MRVHCTLLRPRAHMRGNPRHTQTRTCALLRPPPPTASPRVQASCPLTHPAAAKGTGPPWCSRLLQRRPSPQTACAPETSARPRSAGCAPATQRQPCLPQPPLAQCPLPTPIPQTSCGWGTTCGHAGKRVGWDARGAARVAQIAYSLLQHMKL